MDLLIIKIPLNAILFSRFWRWNIHKISIRTERNCRWGFNCCRCTTSENNDHCNYDGKEGWFHWDFIKMVRFCFSITKYQKIVYLMSVIDTFNINLYIVINQSIIHDLQSHDVPCNSPILNLHHKGSQISIRICYPPIAFHSHYGFYYSILKEVGKLGQLQYEKLVLLIKESTYLKPFHLFLNRDLCLFLSAKV